MKIHEGDCLEVLKTLEPESVHAVVTDPPYGLSFMGKEWDTFRATRETKSQVVKGLGAGMRMTNREENLSYQNWCQAWAKECIRVLKPGGYVLIFGATRTFGRLQCAVEDAGFEVRDTIAWLYGQGFPKSQDISKQMDKMHGAEREVLGENPNSRHGEYESDLFNRERSGFHQKNPITAPSSDDAKEWEGWGTALKPGMELIVMGRKPISEKTVVKNVLKHGTGALNIDACRIPLAGGDDELPKFVLNTEHSAAQPKGASGEEAEWTSRRVKTKKRGEMKKTHGGKISIGYKGDLPDSKGTVWSESEEGRFPANVVHDCSREVVEKFPNSKAGGSVDELPEKHMNVYGKYEMVPEFTSYADDGSASRFFYCSKASKAEREWGLQELEEQKVAMGGGANNAILNEEAYEGRKGGFNSIKKRKNIHPTVKPVSLMRWLVKMVTPPGGTVMDPFTGSGTTGIACILEGFEFVGIEKQPEYIEIACARIEQAKVNPREFIPLENRKHLPTPKEPNPDQMEIEL